MFLRLFLIILTLFSLTVDAKLRDYFKPALNKGANHTMSNIDFIYMINLDQRPEKFERSQQLLKPYGIFPYRFSAVNGWELTLETVNDVGLKYDPTTMKNGIMGTCYLTSDFQAFHEMIQTPGRTYFCHCMARGTIGICLSHLSILQDAYNCGYKTIWVMEDDIEIKRDPRIISDLISALDKKVGPLNWDILFTDQDTRDNNGNYVPCTAAAKRPNFDPGSLARFAKREKIDDTFTRIGARYGAYSMIIKRSGIKKILSFMKEHKIFLPYDMDFYLPLDIKMFCVQNDVVTTQLRAPSDNGGQNYLNKNN